VLSSRFFRRIFLPYLLLICGVALAVGAILAMRIRENYLESRRQSLHTGAVLASEILNNDLLRGDRPAIEGTTRRLAGALGGRLTVIEEDGTVVGDSEADPATMENHRDRGEIGRAGLYGDGEEERTSHTLAAPLLYWAHKVTTADGKVHFVRLAYHLSDIDHQLHLVYVGLAAIVIVAVLTAGLLCFYIARRSTIPVVELTGFARKLTDGDLNQRLLPSGSDEFSSLAGALNTMADSLNVSLEENKKGRAELLAMLASMSEGVIATDTRRRIVIANQRAGEMLSFDAESAPGKALFEVVRDEAVLKASTEVLATGERRAFQISPSAGSYLEITACTYPAGEPPQGLVLVAHDTTQSVRYQELRKEFVANVSHELRTPLTVIKGFTETLRDGAMHDPTNGPRFLATIERHVDQLTNLVSDLLELSKLESTNDVPRAVAFDCSNVVKRAAELLLPASQRKKQSLSVQIPSHLPRVVGNPDYIERAVSNLIDNAIKYTPDGGEVRIKVAMENDSIVIEVIDNGLGIPPQDLSRIFERFYRVDRSRSREMGGTGLGLSIVKHVAQVHGGSIDVQSAPGQGSKFRLKIPLRQPEA
jgi:two-component system phosphate regulon sensor histidine kinase PhoR